MDSDAINRHQAHLRAAQHPCYAPLGRRYGSEDSSPQEVTLAPNVIFHCATAKEAKALSAKLHNAIAAAVAPVIAAHEAEIRKAVG